MNQMTTLTTFDRVSKLLQEHLGVTPQQVTEAALLVDDLGCDSLDIIELSMFLEEGFGVEITDDEADDLFPKGTVADAVRLIEGKLS